MPDTSHQTRRLDALDGLRGVAIILVVLSHGWVLWPTSYLERNGWLETLFTSGDAAVTVFLVASGFLLFRAIAATEGKAAMTPLAVAVRRILRVGPAMWMVLLVVMVVASIDSTDTETKSVNHDSLFHALTYTYNWLVQSDLTGTRVDLGHLWYVSVDMQAVVVVAIIAFFLGHRPRALLLALSGLFVVLVAWRFHSYSVENIWVVFNRTTARMDPLVLGAVAAALVPRMPKADVVYWRASRVLLVMMVPVLYWCHVNAHYLRWGGTALEILVAAFLVCVVLAPARPDPVLGNRVLTLLGRMSLVIYLWHFPIVHFVQRHTLDWAWGWKVVVALIGTVAVSWTAQVLIESRVSRLLARPEWEALREGSLSGLTRKVTGRRRARESTHV